MWSPTEKSFLFPNRKEHYPPPGKIFPKGKKFCLLLVKKKLIRRFLVSGWTFQEDQTKLGQEINRSRWVLQPPCHVSTCPAFFSHEIDQNVIPVMQAFFSLFWENSVTIWKKLSWIFWKKLSFFQNNSLYRSFFSNFP